MSHLKLGTLCVIVGGCPENIGLIVEVVSHLGKYGYREDAYEIKTVTGRNFNQLWLGFNVAKGHSVQAVTDRHKLRPLVGLADESPVSESIKQLDELTI